MRMSISRPRSGLALLLASLIGLPMPVAALLYEIQGEDGRLAVDATGKPAASAPYFGPLDPGAGYDGAVGGFVWRHQGSWQRLDFLAADGAPATELALEGPVDAAYLVMDVGDENDPGVLVSDWNWARCCGDRPLEGGAVAQTEVEVMVSSYSGIGHWYLMTGDVIRPQAKGLQITVATNDGAKEIPLPAIPALLGAGLALLIGWQRRPDRGSRK